MLNNEIQCLNTEKEELEKKLLNPKRSSGKIPCIIIEEENEEELENNSNEHNNRILEKIEEKCSNSETESYSGTLLASESDVDKSNFHDRVISLNKQIEEMTFYVDELKSELEVEKDKNSEQSRDIGKLREELSQLKISEEGKKMPSSSEPTDIRTDNHFRENFLEHFRKLKQEYLEQNNIDSFERSLIKLEISENNSDETVKEINSILFEFVKRFGEILIKKENAIKSEIEKAGYFEKQLEKVIHNFKGVIDELEAKLKVKVKEFDEFKTQVDNLLIVLKFLSKVA